MADALGDEGLGRIRDAAVARLSKGKVVDAFMDAVQEASGLLAYALPPKGRDVHELSNRMLVFHPRP